MRDHDLWTLTLLIAILAILSAGLGEILARLRPRVIYVIAPPPPDGGEELLEHATERPIAIRPGSGNGRPWRVETGGKADAPRPEETTPGAA